MYSLAAEFPNDNPALHGGVIWVVTHPLARPTAEAPVIPESIAPVVSAEPEPVLPIAEVFHEEAQEIEETVVVAEAAPAPVELVVVAAPVAESQPSLLDELASELVVPSRPSGIIAIPPEARLDTFEIEDEEDEVLIEDIEPLVEAVVEGGVEQETAIAAPLESDVILAEAANDVAEPSTSLPPPPDDPFTVFLTTLADVAISAGSPHVAAMIPALLVEGRLDALTDEARAALADASMVDGAGVSGAFAKTLEAWKAILRGTSDDFDATGGVMLDEFASELLARLLGAPQTAANLRRDLRSRGVAAFGLAA